MPLQLATAPHLDALQFMRLQACVLDVTFTDAIC